MNVDEGAVDDSESLGKRLCAYLQRKLSLGEQARELM